MTVSVLARDETDLKKIVFVINQLGQGRSNATGTVTLTASTTTTQVTVPTCSADSVPILVPTTANAASELGAGTAYISEVANGSFTITHASNTQDDRTFRWVFVG